MSKKAGGRSSEAIAATAEPPASLARSAIKYDRTVHDFFRVVSPSFEGEYTVDGVTAYTRLSIANSHLIPRTVVRWNQLEAAIVSDFDENILPRPDIVSDSTVEPYQSHLACRSDEHCIGSIAAPFLVISFLSLFNSHSNTSFLPVASIPSRRSNYFSTVSEREDITFAL